MASTDGAWRDDNFSARKIQQGFDRIGIATTSIWWGWVATQPKIMGSAAARLIINKLYRNQAS